MTFGQNQKTLTLLRRANMIDDATITEAFDFACEPGKVDELRALLEKYPELLTFDEGAGTLLMLAASSNLFDTVKMMLELGADINQEMEMPFDSGGSASLDWAMDEGHVDMARFLVERGAKAANKRAVLIAVSSSLSQEDALEMVKLMSDSGYDVHELFDNQHTGEKINAYSQAVANDQEKAAEFLKQIGCQPPN